MTARVRIKKHGRGYLGTITVPTYLAGERLGAVTTAGVGWFPADALAAAAHVAERIADDPIVKAIMPPQATAAIAVVKALSQAAQQGPKALQQTYDQVKGPGKARLANALKSSTDAPKADAKPAATATAATDNGKAAAAPSGFYGLPSLADVGAVDPFGLNALKAKAQAQANFGRGAHDNRGSGRGAGFGVRPTANAKLQTSVRTTPRPQDDPNADPNQDPNYDPNAYDPNNPYGYQPQYPPGPYYPPQYADNGYDYAAQVRAAGQQAMRRVTEENELPSYYHEYTDADFGEG